MHVKSEIRRLFLTLFVGLSTGFSFRADGEDHWPQFRGPNATGVIEGPTNLPSDWSMTENVAWKADIPGRGWSSPVVWGNRIFLTTVLNLGESEEPKKGLYFGGNRPDPPESKHQWLVICLNAESGEILWRKQVHAAAPETSIHLKNSFASETPVTDGEHLYVMFGGVGIYCFDLQGNEVWKRDLEPRKTRYGWGTAASPVLHGDRLYIVNDNDEQSYLMALNKRTGEQVWRVERDEKSNWATPYVWTNDVRTEIVTPGTGKVRSYDLDGNELWSLSGMSSITIATPYEYQGLLMVSSGYVGDKLRPLYAIRPGAEGDISLQDEETSNTSIAWSQPTGGPYNPSTLAYDGIIYVLRDFGFMAAYDAADGSEVYPKTRIPKGRAFTSSPWAYDGKIFCLNEDGITFVIKAGTEFEVLSTNALADDDMGMATPALAGDRLLIRTAGRLYCIQK
jgi:outer membrane protein assembly factor BamB